MEKSLGAWKSTRGEHDSSDNDTDFKCEECGEGFSRPLLARVSSEGRDVRTYFACPRCLSQVKAVEAGKSEKREESTSLKEPSRASEKLEANVSCQHFLGYLKRRPKNTAVPEDCLMCEKMIECMVY